MEFTKGIVAIFTGGILFVASLSAQESIKAEKSDQPQDSAKETELKFEKRGAVVYQETDDYKLTCDFYVPKTKGPFPTILAVHGGGWRFGSKIQWTAHAWKMAPKGYVVVAINYRKSPKHKFPAQIHDLKQAVRFIRKNASKYKIDPDRIGAFGYSAGGHLVSLLGTTDKNDKLEGDVPKGFEGISTRVRCVVAGGAPCEFDWLGEDSKVLSYFIGDNKTIRNHRNDFERAYPTTYITKDDPPFYFYHDKNDLIVPIKAARVMHEKLQTAKLSSKFVEYDRFGHIALFMNTGETLGDITEFFDKHLKNKKD